MSATLRFTASMNTSNSSIAKNGVRISLPSESTNETAVKERSPPESDLRSFIATLPPSDVPAGARAVGSTQSGRCDCTRTGRGQRRVHIAAATYQALMVAHMAHSSTRLS